MNVFETAAQILRHGRWTKGSTYVVESYYDDELEKFCALGALNVAMGNDPDPNTDQVIKNIGNSEEVAFLSEQIKSKHSQNSLYEGADSGVVIYRYNDRSSRSLEEVVDLLEQTGQKWNARFGQ